MAKKDKKDFVKAQNNGFVVKICWFYADGDFRAKEIAV